MSVVLEEQKVDEQVDSQDIAEETCGETEEQFASYSFVDVKTNGQLNAENLVWEESDIRQGGLVVFQEAEAKQQYYSVCSVEDASQCVELTLAKNAYGKIILMFTLLGVSWIVLDYIMKMLF